MYWCLPNYCPANIDDLACTPAVPAAVLLYQSGTSAADCRLADERDRGFREAIQDKTLRSNSASDTRSSDSYPADLKQLQNYSIYFDQTKLYTLTKRKYILWLNETIYFGSMKLYTLVWRNYIVWCGQTIYFGQTLFLLQFCHILIVVGFVHDAVLINLYISALQILLEVAWAPLCDAVCTAPYHPSFEGIPVLAP